MTKLRVLCIGTGYFAQYHYDAWHRIRDVELVAVCARNKERTARAAERFDIPRAFTDVSLAIDEIQPDIVDIITPPDSHLPLVEMVAKRGLPIICQKPLAPDWPTAKKLVDIVQQANVPFMVHENFRFQPWHREIKRLLDRHVIGSRLHTLHFHTRTGDGWGDDAYLDRQPYFRDMPRLLVHETGVHFIDTFRFLGGEIEEAYAVLRRLNSVIQGEDTGLLTFRFANGAVGVWDANRFNETTDPDPRYTFGQMLVEADGGSIRLYADGRITIQRLGEMETEHVYKHERVGFGGDCVYVTQQHFVDRLRDGEPFETGGEEYLKTLAVVESVYESAKRGHPVRPASVLGPVSPTRHGEQAPQQSLASQPVRRVIDLSLGIDNDMPKVTIQTAKTIATDGWNASNLLLYSHSGTHMDAACHFVDGAATIDEQDLAICCGPAKVIDLTPVQPRESIDVARLQGNLRDIQPGDRLLLRTDWYQRYGTPAYRDELPRISVELARWCVQRGVALIGVEPPSVADVNNVKELTDVHRILLKGSVVIVEGLAQLDQLTADTVEFIALPLNVIGGDGTPVRAVAIEETS
jgi:predicted dehydrogenase/kynurenine formamidase